MEKMGSLPRLGTKRNGTKLFYYQEEIISFFTIFGPSTINEYFFISLPGPFSTENVVMFNFSWKEAQLHFSYYKRLYLFF